MKTMIVKHTALIAALLLICACTSPFVAEKPDTQATGYFSFTLEEWNGQRTIMPASSEYGSGKFDAFILEFIPPEGTSAQQRVTVPRTSADITDPVSLAVGTWTLHATAYKEEDDELLPLAEVSMDITITKGDTTSETLAFVPIASGGTGTFSWDISFPAAVTNASMTIIPYDLATGTPTQTLHFIGETHTVDTVDSCTLNSGYYDVIFKLLDSNGLSTERMETLHIYQNMESSYPNTGTMAFQGGWFTNKIRITSDADSGAGSLRQAIADALAGSIVTIDAAAPRTIAVDSKLLINRNLTIEVDGTAGVTITRGSGYTMEDTMSPLLCVSSGATVKIERVHFKDGRAAGRGSAVCNDNGNVTLVSCIFSGNQITDFSEYGSAVFTEGTLDGSGVPTRTLTLTGCTFYGNSTGYMGGAVTAIKSKLELTGNLFYGNTARFSNPIVYADISSQVTSGGYNVVDVPAANQGWATVGNDTSIGTLPLSPDNFKPLTGGGATGRLTSLPTGYPTKDYYGTTITSGGAAGAVQGSVSGTHYIALTINDTDRGSVTGLAPDANGMHSSLPALEGIPESGNVLLYWVVNGLRIPHDNNTLPWASVEPSPVYAVRAVFGQVIPVSTASALSDAVDSSMNDILIRVTGNIALDGRLDITKNLIIEGTAPGRTISPAGGWTASSASQLLDIASGAEVIISGIHFRGGRANRESAAIRNAGSLTLESCIFSDNQTTIGSGGYGGGAISNTGTLNIRGCTFYNNRAVNTGSAGGAVYNTGTLILLGNLFYGNTAQTHPVVRNGGTVLSDGYNIVSEPIGLSSSGWIDPTGKDNTFAALGISVLPFEDTTGFRPINRSLMINFIPTPAPAGFPAKDFAGADREPSGTNTGVPPGAVTR